MPIKEFRKKFKKKQKANKEYVPQSQRNDPEYIPQSRRMSYDDWRSMGGKERQRRIDRGETTEAPNPSGKLKLSGEEMLKKGGKVKKKRYKYKGERRKKRVVTEGYKPWGIKPFIMKKGGRVRDMFKEQYD